MAHLRPKEKIENDFIGQMLADETNQDFFDLRMEMGKSTSAPPPGLESSPDMFQGRRQDPTATEQYYYYYHSLKPHDPRLPLPKWNPTVYTHDNIQQLNQRQPENLDNGANRKASLPDSYPEMQSITRRFDQAITISPSNDFQQKSFPNPQSPQLKFEDNKKVFQPQPVIIPQQENPTYNMGSSPVRKATYPMGSTQSHKQNHIQHQSHTHHNPQNFNNPGVRHQQNVPQGQYFPGMEQQQMGGPYFNQPFMNPQMQATPFYGMNTFQPQMYQYGMDPNMMATPNNFQPMPNPQFNAGGMGQMGGMGGMGQYYGNNGSYMNNYYPMGFQQGMQGNFQQGGFNNPQPKNPMKLVNKNVSPKVDIKQVLSNLIENCRDQNGSRLIQQHFEKSNELEKEQMFQQILPHAFSLMTDVFGNYVIQKILDLGTVEQKIKIFDTMRWKIFQLSQHTYGCRVVQKALDELKINGLIQDQVLNEIRGDIIQLIEDQNGNHVIQKCFETMPDEKTQFIIEEVTNNEKIDRLAFHPYGCRVIQRILEHSSPEITEPMLSRLMDNALDCCECQYGNYIMQYMLEKGPYSEKIRLLNVIRDNFVRLSMNKFASNVTEKSVKHGTPEFRKGVIEVLCNTYHENKPALVVMMTHSFGNYVVQRLFECSDEQLRQILYEKMQGSIDDIKRNNYGKHVMTFIEKFMEGRKGGH